MNKEHIGSNFGDFWKAEYIDTFEKFEIRELAKIIDSKNGTILTLKVENERLKAGNEELKEENAILKLITEPQREEIQKYRDKALQLKQALEEVRELANLCLNRSDCIMCPNYDKCEIEDAEIPTHDVCKPIISKINEVLKDE